MASPAADRRLADTGEFVTPPLSAPFAVRPATVISAALLLLCVGNLGLVPIMNAGAMDAPVHFNELLVAAILAIGLLAGLRARAWRVDALGSLGIAFAALGGISAVLAVPRLGLSAFELIFSLAYLARWLAYFGIYLVAINTLRAEDVPAVWRALEATILVFAAFGIMQSLFLPGFAQLVYPESVLYVDFDPQGHRLVSTMLDPNLAGCLIAIGLLVLLGKIAAGNTVAWWKPVLLLAALVLTLSRGSVVAFGVGGLVILGARGLSRRLLRLTAAIGVLALPFVPTLLTYAREFNKLSLDPSALGRITIWLRALRVFVDHPVIGIGFNTFGFVQRRYGWLPGGRATFGTDGGLLFIAVMTGVVGLTLYLGLIGVALRRCRRVWRDAERSRDDRGLAIGVAAATVAVVVDSVFVNSLIHPFITEPLWVLWALVFVTMAPSHRRATPVPGPAVVCLPPSLRSAPA